MEIIPLPGIAASGHAAGQRKGQRGKWKVVEADPKEVPSTNHRTKTITVPLDDSPISAESRRHETAHAAWTDPQTLIGRAKELGLQEVIWQASEDARINTSLANLGLPLRTAVLDTFAKKISAMGLGDQLATLLCTVATGDEALVRKHVKPVISDVADTMLKLSGIERQEGLVIPQEATLQLLDLIAAGGKGEGASELGTGPGNKPGDGPKGPTPAPGGKPGMSGPPNTEFKTGAAPPSAVKPGMFSSASKAPATLRGTAAAAAPRPVRSFGAAGSGATTAVDGEITSKMIEEFKQSRAAAEDLASQTESNDGVKPIPSHLLDVSHAGGGDFSHGSGKMRDKTETPQYSGWTQMHIVEPSRPRRVPARVRGRKHGVNEMGTLPVALHRATIDGRVFKATRIKPASGTVLIDNSGSMGFQTSDLVEIMAALPAGTIADYCSVGGPTGQLRILAKKGRMVAERTLNSKYGGANGCDGPALRWLLQQPGPRFWVCDGGITGKHDRAFVGGGTECAVLAEAGKVIQLRNIDELREMIKSKKINLRRHPVVRAEDRPKIYVLWK